MAFTIHLDGVSHDVEIVGRRPHLRLKIKGREYEVTRVDEEADGRQVIEVSGETVRFTRARGGGHQFLQLNGRVFVASLADPRDQAEGEAGGQDYVHAPMPGSVVSLHKQAGDAVMRGETLITIESMKLQIALGAPRDGRLRAILYAVGEKFDRDEIVAELEPLPKGSVKG